MTSWAQLLLEPVELWRHIPQQDHLKKGWKCGYFSCIVSEPHSKKVDCNYIIPTMWGACPKNARDLWTHVPAKRGNMTEKRLTVTDVHEDPIAEVTI